MLGAMVSTADQLAIEAADLMVQRLGESTVPTPLTRLLLDRASSVHYVHESDRVLLDDTLEMAAARNRGTAELPSFEPGGPRERLYFDPTTTRVGIVSCGGLCPGLNNVIRGLVLELSQLYGGTEIVGFRNGFRGLVEGDPPITLTPDVVRDIHNRGGTILGTSRGDQNAEEMADTLSRLDISILFVLGGDGTLRGAQKIVDAAATTFPTSITALGSRPRSAELNLRYVDPGYAIRSVQANAFDAVFCIRLAQAAVHAAMAGRTAMVVGRWHGRFVRIPISLATASRNQVDPDGDLWMSVLEATGQPPRFRTTVPAPNRSAVLTSP
jgi:6-phosphofructokinase 1